MGSGKIFGRVFVSGEMGVISERWCEEEEGRR